MYKQGIICHNINTFNLKIWLWHYIISSGYWRFITDFVLSGMLGIEILWKTAIVYCIHDGMSLLIQFTYITSSISNLDCCQVSLFFLWLVSSLSTNDELSDVKGVVASRRRLPGNATTCSLIIARVVIMSVQERQKTMARAMTLSYATP